MTEPCGSPASVASGTRLSDNCTRLEKKKKHILNYEQNLKLLSSRYLLGIQIPSACTPRSELSHDDHRSIWKSLFGHNELLLQRRVRGRRVITIPILTDVELFFAERHGNVFNFKLREFHVFKQFHWVFRSPSQLELVRCFRNCK